MIRSKDKRALRCSVAVPVWPVCGFSPSEQHPQLPGQHLPGPPWLSPPRPAPEHVWGSPHCSLGAAERVFLGLEIPRVHHFSRYH